MSVPPIINSEHSKIRLGTRNVFIDVTGTDMTKVLLALNTLVTDFAEYCESIEAVEVVQADGTTIFTPIIQDRTEQVSVDYITRLIGVKLDQRRFPDC